MVYFPQALKRVSNKASIHERLRKLIYIHTENENIRKGADWAFFSDPRVRKGFKQILFIYSRPVDIQFLP